MDARGFAAGFAGLRPFSRVRGRVRGFADYGRVLPVDIRVWKFPSLDQAVTDRTYASAKNCLLLFVCFFVPLFVCLFVLLLLVVVGCCLSDTMPGVTLQQNKYDNNKTNDHDHKTVSHLVLFVVCFLLLLILLLLVWLVDRLLNNRWS